MCAVTANAISPGVECETLPREEMEVIAERIDLQLIENDDQTAGIQCFDVKQDGTIALGIGSGSGNRIYVYDALGEFQYGYRFQVDGDYGIAFQEENLLIFFLRGNEVAVCDSAGAYAAIYRLRNAPQNYAQIKGFLNQTVKEAAGKTYMLERDFGIGDAYSRLVAVDACGEKTVLYDAAAQHAGGQIVFVSGIAAFFAFIILGIIKKRTTGRFETSG